MPKLQSVGAGLNANLQYSIFLILGSVFLQSTVLQLTLSLIVKTKSISFLLMTFKSFCGILKMLQSELEQIIMKEFQF